MNTALPSSKIQTQVELQSSEPVFYTSFDALGEWIEENVLARPILSPPGLFIALAYMLAAGTSTLSGPDMADEAGLVSLSPVVEEYDTTPMPTVMNQPAIAPEPVAPPMTDQSVPLSMATATIAPVLKAASTDTGVIPHSPFDYYDHPLDAYEQAPQRWLWQDRIPLNGMTLLDGDLGCGKSVFSLLLAAHVSAGTSLPDGSPTIQGGVVIVAPYEEAGKGIYALLIANGAIMSNIRIISFVPDTSSEAAELGLSHRHFQLPDDLKFLRTAMQEVNARLVILDSFIETLPDEGRFTQAKLRPLLRKLHQVMIEMDATCLLTRQCPARGGMARPTGLERSMHFLNIAASRLLLAHDPTQPGRFLLTHVACRVQGVAPTISFTISSHLEQPRHPVVTFTGLDALQSHDLLTQHPGTLHLKILASRLQVAIAASSEPTSVAVLRTRFPRSTPSQVQRTLRQLVQAGTLERVGRGLYVMRKRE